MARETGLEPATSGVTGRVHRNNIKGDPKTAIKKSLAISVRALGGFGTDLRRPNLCRFAGVDWLTPVAPFLVDPKQRKSRYRICGLPRLRRAREGGRKDPRESLARLSTQFAEAPKRSFGQQAHSRPGYRSAQTHFHASSDDWSRWRAERWPIKLGVRDSRGSPRQPPRPKRGEETTIPVEGSGGPRRSQEVPGGPAGWRR